ncbi:hypothetical protein [Halorhabdus sp. CUG00001]|uniref:hypothetical protein n=1 Tax=Halorhabdus sp. CUG00001 TaxID=2600297 RepID=UPI00131D1C24|nr:hypothetical protein [Halorhabdus sp. CUG00001]
MADPRVVCGASIDVDGLVKVSPSLTRTVMNGGCLQENIVRGRATSDRTQLVAANGLVVAVEP